jgi:hypothetical protein
MSTVPSRPGIDRSITSMLGISSIFSIVNCIEQYLTARPLSTAAARWKMARPGYDKITIDVGDARLV